MVTLSFIKRCAQSLEPDTINRCKAHANSYEKWGLWWTFECIEMYQYFLVFTDKVFWWMMVVKTLRYANDYWRKNGKQNTQMSL